jgi:hypothetical protein
MAMTVTKAQATEIEAGKCWAVYQAHDSFSAPAGKIWRLFDDVKIAQRIARENMLLGVTELSLTPGSYGYCDVVADDDA